MALHRKHLRTFLLFIIGIAVFCTTIVMIATSLLLTGIRVHQNKRIAPLLQNVDIPQLRAVSKPTGTYTIRGYVVRRSTCPPCTTVGICQPCPPDSVVVSSNKQEMKDTEPLTDNEVIVVVNDAQRFKEKTVYTMTVLKRGPELYLRSASVMSN